MAMCGCMALWCWIMTCAGNYLSFYLVWFTPLSSCLLFFSLTLATTFGGLQYNNPNKYLKQAFLIFVKFNKRQSHILAVIMMSFSMKRNSKASFLRIAFSMLCAIYCQSVVCYCISVVLLNFSGSRVHGNFHFIGPNIQSLCKSIMENVMTKYSVKAL